MKFTLRPQRRQSGRTGPGISLFPFLAVLICTMGALVPLLLAMMRTARLQAEADAVAKATEYAAQHSVEVQTKREDVQWRIEQLKGVRKQTEKQLADARFELGHLEDHSRRLRAQLEQYQNTVASLENIENADRRQHGQSEAELQQIGKQIAAARQQVDQARKTAAGRGRAYAVVPYEGPNQTRRRPIYLECLTDSVILQPEGIRLTESDFEGPMGPGNPLAAALRAAREHLMAEGGFDPQAGEPYPMLLVRPKGIGAYYAAREAMKSWGCDFGYELVGDDWNLAYPPPNPRLAEVVQQAIASARINQARLIAAAPRQYPSRSKATYRASPEGGFVREDGGSEDDDSGYLAAAPAGSIGRNGGSYGGHGNGSGGYSSQGNATGNEYNPYVAAVERPGTAVAGGSGSGVPFGDASSSAGPMLAAPDGNRVANGGAGGVPGGGAGGMANGNPGGTGNGMGNGTPDGMGNGTPGGTSNGTPGGTGNGMAGGMGNGMAGGMANGNAGGTGNGNAGGTGNGNAGGMSPAGTYASYNPMRGGAGDGTSASPYVTMSQRPDAAANGSGVPSGGVQSGGVPSGGSSPTASQRSNGSQNNGAAAERPDGYVVGQPLREAQSPTTADPQRSSDAAPGRGHAARRMGADARASAEAARR